MTRPVPPVRTLPGPRPATQARPVVPGQPCPACRRTVGDWMSVTDVSDTLGVSKMTVYRLVETEELIGYRIGRSIRIKAADLEGFLLDARTTRSAATG